MQKIFITGVSGTGKTSVAKELERRGFHTIGIDEVKDLCAWRHKVTKEKVTYKVELNKDFIDNHDWVCDVEYLKKLIEDSTKPVFVCGIASNQNDFMHIFDRVLLLQCSPETFISRIEKRTDNNFGKDKTAQEVILGWYKSFENDTLKRGAININAENPLNTVVDDIIKKTLLDDWSDYHKKAKSKPPSELLVKALEYVETKNKAIDIGAGSLRDSRYLLEKGFDVTAIDKFSLMKAEAEALGNDNIKAFVTLFENFSFPKEEYDIASAMFSLPFIEPTHFKNVFNNIVGSLKKGGIFCFQLFGTNDEWNNGSQLNFHNASQVKDLLTDLKTIHFDEIEKDDFTSSGTPKHWHYFNIIVNK